MKQLLKLIPVMLMLVAVSVAGCGEKKDDAGGGGDDKGGESASAPADAKMVMTKVSLPNMDWN